MYKNILVLKRIDFWVQVFLTFLWLLFVIFNSFPISFFSFIILSYQIFSLIFFGYLSKDKLKSRRIYEISLFLILIFTILLCLATFWQGNMTIFVLIYFLFYFLLPLMVFVQPLMAIFYLWITWTELQILEKVNLAN